MNLIIDIGNTTAKLAAFDGDEPIGLVRTDNMTLEALPAFARKYKFERGIVSSVIGFTPQVEEMIHGLAFPVLRFTPDTPIPLRNLYRTPRTLGADRLAAAVGAYARFPGRNLLIIDAGTCLTYEFVGGDGTYRGGNIAPGLQMRLKALHTFTARLPQVTPDGPAPAIGEDTETAIRAGVMQGIRFEIEGYIAHYREKDPTLLVFLTGGEDLYFDEQIKSSIFADKFIVPRGLNTILRYNNDKI